MKDKKLKLLLILGCQRSGTTLLTAMLGGHSEINMLFESTTKDVLKLIGKEVNGNKLLVWRQIRMNQRASKFGHLMNRIANFDFFPKTRHHKLRPFPTSAMSIQDYIDKGATIITITRNRDEVLKSITSRTKMSQKQAEREYNKSISIMNSITENVIPLDYYDIVHSPAETLTMICNKLGLDFEERMMQGHKYNFVYPNKSIIKEKSKKTASEDV